MLGT
jgi:hypothetical protein